MFLKRAGSTVVLVAGMAAAMFGALGWESAQASTPARAIPDTVQQTPPMTHTMPITSAMPITGTMPGMAGGDMPMDHAMPALTPVQPGMTGQGQMMAHMAKMQGMMARMQQMMAGGMMTSGAPMTGTMPMAGMMQGDMGEMMGMMAEMQSMMAEMQGMMAGGMQGGMMQGGMMQGGGMQGGGMQGGGMSQMPMMGTMIMVMPMPMMQGMGGMMQQAPGMGMMPGMNMGGMMGQMPMMQGMGGMMGQNTPPAGTPGAAATPAQATGTAQTGKLGEIEVKGTPPDLNNIQGETIDFTIDLNATGANLAFDLAKQATLRIGDHEMPATAWEVAYDHGHHVNGVLKFPAHMQGAVESATLTITGPTGDGELTLTWPPTE